MEDLPKGPKIAGLPNFVLAPRKKREREGKSGREICDQYRFFSYLQQPF
jgi:hypothetical protein